jgi:copper chaperone CopZ
MKSQELSIRGMSCGHCVMHVQKALMNISGVQVDDVQIGSAKLTVDEATVTPDVLRDAVKRAGYELVAIS